MDKEPIRGVASAARISEASLITMVNNVTNALNALNAFSIRLCLMSVTAMMLMQVDTGTLRCAETVPRRRHLTTTESKFRRMPHFEALREGFEDLNGMLLGRGALREAAIQQIYDRHFFADAFPTRRAKSRPQFSDEVYPSLFRSLKVLPDGRPINSQDLPLPWENWEALSDALVDNPLAQVLVGFIWKQGDINTLRHVFRGLHGEANGDNESVVMYQFGRHLADPAHQPIFDQHTYRAYRLVEVIDQWENRADYSSLFAGQQGFNKGNTLPPGALESYLFWWNQKIAERLPQPASERLAALSAIDRLLFSLGKAAKLQVNV